MASYCSCPGWHLLFKVHGLQDALDQVTREKRVLLGELGRERERGEEEGRRVKEMEERLSHCNVANMELQKVPLCPDLGRLCSKIRPLYCASMLPTTTYMHLAIMLWVGYYYDPLNNYAWKLISN